MSDKFTHMSTYPVNLKDYNGDESKYALGVSVESSSTSSPVYVSSGNSNTTASQTRSNNTVSYTAYDVVGEATASNLVFSNVCSNNGGGFIVLGANLEIDVNAIPSGMSGFKVHLYNAAPSAITDNSAYNLPSGDRSKYLGNIYLATPDDLGDTIYSQNDNINFKSVCASGTNTVYGILQTVGAYTPSVSEVATVTLKVVDV